MKVLFVDNSSELQQKWLDPLRKEGWGVIRARSVEDANRMMILHGENIESVVVTEKFAAFAEKADLPYVVLTQAWSENQISRHQTVEKAAFAYLSFQASVNELKRALEDYRRGVKQAGKAKAPTPAPPPKKIGTELALEDFGDVMKRPEATRISATISHIRLEAPKVLLGGEDATKVLTMTRAQMEDLQEIKLPEPESSLQNEVSDLSIDESIPESELEAHDFSMFEPLPEAQIYTASAAVDISQFSVNPSPVSMPGDVDTLKSYLALREQDVSVLTGQVRSSQERIHQLETQLKVERARSAELQHVAQKQEQQLKSFNQDKQVELEVLDKQAQDLNQQLKDRTDKLRLVEVKLKVTTEEVDKVKERVRVDLRRIRVREKELENQLEILKKDSTALMIARDEKIVELKRKLDLLEFNMELVQEQYNKERQATDALRARLKDAAQAMRQAGGYLDQEA